MYLLENNGLEKERCLPSAGTMTRLIIKRRGSMAGWWRPINIRCLASDNIIAQTFNYHSFQHLLWLHAALLMTYFDKQLCIRAPAIHLSRAPKYMPKMYLFSPEWRFNWLRAHSNDSTSGLYTQMNRTNYLGIESRGDSPFQQDLSIYHILSTVIYRLLLPTIVKLPYYGTPIPPKINVWKCLRPWKQGIKGSQWSFLQARTNSAARVLKPQVVSSPLKAGYKLGRTFV